MAAVSATRAASTSAEVASTSSAATAVNLTLTDDINVVFPIPPSPLLLFVAHLGQSASLSPTAKYDRVTVRFRRQVLREQRCYSRAAEECGHPVVFASASPPRRGRTITPLHCFPFGHADGFTQRRQIGMCFGPTSDGTVTHTRRAESVFDWAGSPGLQTDESIEVDHPYRTMSND
ncbi:hypothetical protein EVAR_102709_1 [Eumeta japonica]|uniref:Uncharacterized protein n=1 Tax=Eumeta variegata TaxID=151549 RepID=A0A4C1THR7_EUMVA|nr:hypothetical protein EVAR_102709_1 [Eumeta japonica]